MKEDDCLIWQGATHRQGYGMVRLDGKMTTTHRAVGLETHGNPGNPRVYQFTHTCGNLLCCNPRHIVVKTAREIMIDSVENRLPRIGNTKRLTVKEILEIKYHTDTSWGSSHKLAKKYDISDSVVGKIRRGETYKWIK